MSEPFIAEIRMFGFGFPPRGWAQCDGQILQISQFQAVFSLLGTTYGGDGRTTFALPDLRGRAPVHEGQGQGLSNRTLGEKTGQEAVTLTAAQMPAHSHDYTLKASTDAATATTPAGNLPATVAPAFNVYGVRSSPASGPGAQVSTVGGQGHDNMQPCLAVNFCIALQGVFPSRN